MGTKGKGITSRVDEALAFAEKLMATQPLFAKVNTAAFRLLKNHTPGPYTYILNATREVPRLLMHEKRRTIGLRVPDHPIMLALLEELGAEMEAMKAAHKKSQSTKPMAA